MRTQHNENEILVSANMTWLKHNATYFLWGGPPGPQAHPQAGFLGPRRMAGQGAGCGSGHRR